MNSFEVYVISVLRSLVNSKKCKKKGLGYASFGFVFKYIYNKFFAFFSLFLILSKLI